MKNVPMKVAISSCFSGLRCESSSPCWQVPSSDVGRRQPLSQDPKETGVFLAVGDLHTDQGSQRLACGSLLSKLSIHPPPGLDLESESLPGTPSRCGSERRYASESEVTTPGDWRDMRECRTTLHLRNLPCYFTRSRFLGLLDAKGFAGQYDYVYLPMDFRTMQSIGYAFVNFRTSAAALLFRAAMHGFSQWPIHSHKVCVVQWSQTQGYEANVQLVRRSGVMNKVWAADEYKPVVLVNGQMTPLNPLPQRRGKTEWM